MVCEPRLRTGVLVSPEGRGNCILNICCSVCLCPLVALPACDAAGRIFAASFSSIRPRGYRDSNRGNAEAFGITSRSGGWRVLWSLIQFRLEHLRAFHKQRTYALDVGSDLWPSDILLSIHSSSSGISGGLVSCHQCDWHPCRHIAVGHGYERPL